MHESFWALGEICCLGFHVLCFAGIKASGFWIIVILCAEFCSYLSWMAILFIGFGALSGSKRVWLVWLSGRECFWDPALFGHGIFQLGCVSWYWELTLRDGDMLERKWTEGIHGREKSWLWHLDLFSTIIMGTEWQERPLLVVCYRFGMRLICCVWRRGKKLKVWRLPTYFPGLSSTLDSMNRVISVKAFEKCQFFPGQYG